MATVRIREGDLRAAMRDRRYWQAGHPERATYAAWVSEGRQRLHGPDATTEGGERIVQVRAHDRTRNGRREQVDADASRRPSGRGGSGDAVRAAPPRAAAETAPDSRAAAGDVGDLHGRIARWDHWYRSTTGQRDDGSRGRGRIALGRVVRIARRAFAAAVLDQGRAARHSHCRDSPQLGRRHRRADGGPPGPGGPVGRTSSRPGPAGPGGWLRRRPGRGGRVMQGNSTCTDPRTGQRVLLPYLGGPVSRDPTTGQFYGRDPQGRQYPLGQNGLWYALSR